MNILFFLTPKSEVDYIYEDSSLLKTIQKFDENNYAAIPIISKDGKYVGTVSSGDLLGCVKDNFNLSLKEASELPLRNVRRLKDNKAVKADCRIEVVLDAVLTQNFVPVVDDEGNFIGIVTRREVIKWLHDEYKRLGIKAGETDGSGK